MFGIYTDEKFGKYKLETELHNFFGLQLLPLFLFLGVCREMEGKDETEDIED